MNTTIKWIAVLLAVTLMGIVPPNGALCAGPERFAKADTKPITRHEPQHQSEPLKDIATAVKEKKPPWALIGAGVALAALLALAGSSGGGGGGPVKPDVIDTGSVTAGW